MDIFNIPK